MRCALLDNAQTWFRIVFSPGRQTGRQEGPFNSGVGPLFCRATGEKFASLFPSFLPSFLRIVFLLFLRLHLSSSSPLFLRAIDRFTPYYVLLTQAPSSERVSEREYSRQTLSQSQDASRQVLSSDSQPRDNLLRQLLFRSPSFHSCPQSKSGFVAGVAEGRTMQFHLRLSPLRHDVRAM